MDIQAQALAQHLTPDELRKVASFYSSPAGKKVLERLPEAQSEVAQQLQARLATAVPEIVQRFAPKALGPQGGSSVPGVGAPATPPPATQGRRPPADGAPQRP